MEHGIQAQTQEQFDSAIDVLESYKNRSVHLNTSQIRYLMTGTAILLFSLLVDCPPAIGAKYVLRLLQVPSRVENKQRRLPLEHLGLPMAVYALSRHDYPGWTRPSPLDSISRAERAIEMTAYYVSQPSELNDDIWIMIKLGLLELLSDPEEYKLDDGDIVTISEVANLVADAVGHNNIHTLSTNSHVDSYLRAFRAVTTMILNEHGNLSRDAIAIICLTTLNLTPMEHLPVDFPLGQVYAFVIECGLSPPRLSSGLEACGQNIALDLLRKFRDYSDWTQDHILDLARSLGKKQTFKKFKEASEAEANENSIMKLFATGQAWFLIDLAIQSETADHEGWMECLSPFVGDESAPDLAMRRLGEQRSILADQYRIMWENEPVPHHGYLRTLYDSLPPAEAGEGNPRSTHE
ncbi:hypothetical protein FRC11_005972 [Ceratobasidium sp. 423]|nr:hypothetical protein FRC11_005972 [Ceratobasidium sp. 423]